MADAGGVVYLLSSYQSGKERQGAQGRGWGGRDGGRESEEEVRGRRGGGGMGGDYKRNTLFQPGGSDDFNFYTVCDPPCEKLSAAAGSS